ncbi:hypothetical protein BOW14_12755 [Solemya velum gill symbiont]|uniref:outer membrane protein n=1 Tax=Solemya velum gill symbiont TaxID=2340 RepID=UPI0009CC7BD0|nr:outer membrane beta-barrel protein [Solemya velum gill symbiont]OOY83917.1 hypothetical protein BOW14_12755 [Solemya velum gill symbiont]
MTFKKTAIALTFLGLGVSGLAIASPIQTGSPYVSLQLGYGGIDSKSYGNLGTTGNRLTQKNTGFSYRVSGGYLFNITNNLKIGPELGYFGYPKDKYTHPNFTFELKGYSVDLLANARYTFNNMLYGFVKGGFAYTQQKLTMSNPANPNQNLSNTKSKLLPALEVGLGYKINQNMSLDASYHRVFGDADVLNGGNLNSLNDAKIGPVSAWLVGFNYNF